MSLKKQKAYQKGIEAEKISAQALQRKGYKILEQRYKTPGGEIDLVALKGRSLVFVEVKAHKNEEQALYAVTEQSRRRIENAALHFIAHNEGYNEFDMRFDVMIVPPELLKSGGFFKVPVNVLGAISVRHLDNAWLAGQ